jgi:hypothetical protein
MSFCLFHQTAVGMCCEIAWPGVTRPFSTTVHFLANHCDFGTKSREDAARQTAFGRLFFTPTGPLFTSFFGNSTGLDQSSHGGGRRHGVRAGRSDLLQNNTTLRQLGCSSSHLCMDGVRALQPGLWANRTLQNLNLSDSLLGDAWYSPNGRCSGWKYYNQY